MAEMKDIVKLAVDTYKGNVEKYSVAQSNDVLRQALVEANNGSTVLNYKDIRDGKCNGLFTLIEEILSRTVVEGLQGDEYFNALVDFRNVAEGDQNLFLVEDNNLFVVAEAADGTQGIRRQRLGGVKETSIPTSLKVVRIYEELNRVLAGRVDFNEFINKVAESFRQKLLNDIYTLWAGATAADMGGIAYFPTAGTYSEDDLLDVISHVEAAAGGKQATIIGTKKALRALKESIQSDGAKEELHGMGYYGKFFGTPCVAVPQRHKVGTTNFVMADDVLTIIAGDDKPIKVVYEGNPIVLMGDPMTNADFTQEYLYGEKYGMGIVLAGGNAGIGRYEW
ncbi:MAG: hypothetical protein IJ640_02810 [Prevotella sp.]|nr:hypothetical protein [Prevotella sp.]